jgi:hypothetical protein
MTIGTGIFLSTLLLVLTFIVNRTRSRWNVKKSFIVIMAISALLFSVFITIYLIQERPQVQNELWGVKLGDTIEEVSYLKGKANTVLGKDGHYDSSFVYDSEKPKYVVSFVDNKVVSVQALFGKKHDYTKIQGVWSFGDEKSVEDKFGKPDESKLVADGSIRKYKYNKYHLVFLFKKTKIYSWGIYLPKVI